MSKDILTNSVVLAWFLALALPSQVIAQVPVDENGTPVAAASAADAEIPLLSGPELEALVGSIALYPDDLLAIVLPASTYPLQLVQADRFLQDLKSDPELEPDESWDDSIVALLNYPEAIALMTKDLDKTWRLGEAVVVQQADVIAAIESFRDQAYAAGNLQSDSKQTVAQNDGVIEISPVEEDVIYVPYYEPEEVVVYQPRPVYYYYPRAYPVYYYPYPYGYSFNHGFFWGVTTAFTVGWLSDSLHVYHHSYYGHPFYGSYYGYNYWYRRPSIHVHNNYYYGNNNYVYNRHGHGDYWRPHSRSTVNYHDQRVTRSRHYPGTGSTRSTGGESERLRSRSTQRLAADSRQQSPQVKFRQRTATTSNQSSSIRPTQARSAPARESSDKREKILFQDRPNRSASKFASNKLPDQDNARRASGSSQVRPSQDPSPRRVIDSGHDRASQQAQPRQSERSSQARLSQEPKSRQPTASSYPRVSEQPKASPSQRSSQPRRAATSRQSPATKSAPNKVARSEGKSRDRGDSRRR